MFNGNAPFNKTAKWKKTKIFFEIDRYFTRISHRHEIVLNQIYHQVLFLLYHVKLKSFDSQPYTNKLVQDRRNIFQLQ